MELRDASKIVVDLMNKHGLLLKGWTFEFDRAQQRLGQTNYRLKRITISRYMASHADEETVSQVALHEVAHALVGPRVQAHGAEWKAMAASIGYKGKRTARNPYVDAKREKEKVAAMMAAPLPAGQIGIGTKLVIPNGKVVRIVKKARTSFHAEQVDDTKRLYRIPFTLAPRLKVVV